jgi:hypothetical protein
VACHDDSGDLSELDRTRALADHWAGKAGLPAPLPIVMGSFTWSAQAQYKTGLPWWKEGQWHLRALAGSYAAAALIHAVQLGGFETLVLGPTTGGDPADGGPAAMQLLGPHGEQWATYNALCGWRQTALSEILASHADLPPGVYALATRAAHGSPGGERLGLVLAHFGYAVRQSRTVSIDIRHLNPGTWTLERYLVDRAHSSRCDAAIMQQPEGAGNSLERVEQRELTVGPDGTLTWSVELTPCSCTFVTIGR